MFNNKAYRLQKTLARFGSTDMGRGLLDFARENGVTFDMRDIEGQAMAMFVSEAGEGATPIGQIVLNSKECDDLHVMNLAHELRHAWQHKYNRGLREKALSPRAEVALLRHIEADAWAFSHFFMEDFKKSTSDDSVCEAYRLFTASRGMSISKMQGVSYADKIEGYVTELGNSFGRYDVRACVDAVGCLKEGDAALLTDEEEVALVTQTLRSFDRPWRQVPAPFAHLQDADFLSFSRITLTPENVEILRQCQSGYRNVIKDEKNWPPSGQGIFRPAALLA